MRIVTTHSLKNIRPAAVRERETFAIVRRRGKKNFIDFPIIVITYFER